MNLKRKVNRRIESEKRAMLSRDPANIANAITAMKAGLTCHERGRLSSAITHYRKAIEYHPLLAEAHNALGVALYDHGAIEEALDAHQRAALLKPDYADAFFHSGCILLEQRKYKAAAQMLQQVINIDPSYVQAYDKIGQTLYRMYLFEPSEKAYAAGLKIDPGNAGILHNMALVLMLMGRRSEAMPLLQKAITSAPHKPLSQCYLLNCKMFLCDWENIEAQSRDLVDLVHKEQIPVDPFTFQALPCETSNADQFACARANAKALTESISRIRDWPHFEHRHIAGDRIRVGYVSMDFRSHPMAYLMTDVLLKHDRNRFEIFAYSYGPPDSGPERHKFIEAVDHFIDIEDLTDIEAAQRINDDGIDILIDRKGYTFGNRLGIFALRPAPIQVNYLAYAGMMGVDFIDYAVVDEFIVPRDQQVYYPERLVFLPDCYQPNSYRPVSSVTPSREECGLPLQAFVFCAFNQTNKITPRIFDVWMRILHRAPESVLWVMKPDEVTASNLRREAIARGIDPARLAFAPKMEQSAHLARHRHADLYLDTLAVNGHTSASDALFMGVPVITRPGKTFAARVAGSVLRGLEMPELVVNTVEDYEELAVALATNPEQLRALRKKIAVKRDTAPLFNTTRYTRHLDAAYLEMWRLHQEGESPKPFTVTPIS